MCETVFTMSSPNSVDLGLELEKPEGKTPNESVFWEDKKKKYGMSFYACSVSRVTMRKN